MKSYYETAIGFENPTYGFQTAFCVSGCFCFALVRGLRHTPYGWISGS